MLAQEKTLRLLPLEVNFGQEAMALDEVLLEKAAQGQASLRFYQWASPTVSLGYFQPFDASFCFKGLEVVRRPTGGDLLIHHHELTYALALPDEMVPQKVEELACMVHRAIASLLEKLGVPTGCQSAKGKLEMPAAPEGVLCFLHPAAGDVLVNGCKVVGSAQRRRQGGLIQHGSVLLNSSSHAPWLKGVFDFYPIHVSTAELAKLLSAEIPLALNLITKVDSWTQTELDRAAHLVECRYGSADWNNRR